MIVKKKAKPQFCQFPTTSFKIKRQQRKRTFFISDKDLLFVIHSCTDAVLETKTNRVRSSVENLKEPRICQREMRNCCWVKRERLQLDKGTVLSKT